MPSLGNHIFFTVALIPLLFTAPSDGGKILVYPVDGSHWINMKIVIEELHTRGHSIDVIRASDSWYIREESPLYSSITIPVETPVENFFLIYLDNFMKVSCYKFEYEIILQAHAYGIIMFKSPS